MLCLEKEASYKLPLIENFICILQQCRKERNLAYAKQIHGYICNEGLESHRTIGNYIVPMLVDCGGLPDAQQVFNRLLYQNEHSWTSLILGYTEYGQSQLALTLYQKMQEISVHPSRYTLIALLKACARLKDMKRGGQVHAEIREKELDTDIFVASTLIDMYMKCGSLAEAQKVFDKLPICDVVSWTALIIGYAENGLCQEALNCFDQMQVQGVSPDAFTFACILNVCGSMRAIQKGREIHTLITGKKFDRDPIVGNSLVDMYGKCGSLLEAEEVFKKLPVRNVVSWNTLIARYAEHGFFQEAIKCLESMQLEGASPDVVSWNALISGYAEHGACQEALKCFDQMQQENVCPDSVTFISVLKVCGSIGAISKGQEIHAEIKRRGFDSDIPLGNILIDMYAKCGLLSQAKKVFNNLPIQDVVSWGAMINGYGMNHEGNMAVLCFEDMREQGVKPDAITFTSLLTACSRSNLVMKGHKYFTMMRKEYGIMPNIDHYTCIVDLLARSGHLREVEKFLEGIPYPLSTETWTALLSGCKTYGNSQIGLRCFRQLVQMNPENSASYALMANIYTNAGEEGAAYKIEELRKLAGVKKKPASAFIEVDRKVYEFVVGNNQSKEISDMLECLNSSIKKEGHVPHLDMVLAPLSDHEKDAALCQHAEKLAVAFGLLNTPQGQTLHVTKNMSMCNNCHNANKNISSIVGREIIVRDSYCVHRFKNGLCSCSAVF